jgi:protein gp37
MADLFGDWVPDEWISNVIHACWRSNDMDADAVDRNGNKLVRGKPDGELHTFLFLTKNPKRIAEFEKKHFWLGSAVRPKMWFGTTVTGASDQDRVNELGNFNSDNVFLSIEPLLEALDISKLADSLQRRKYCFQKCSQINGVIVGAESGKRKGKVTPRREWIDDIVRGCDICGVPVFMKDSLLSIVGAENMRRELPWEVHKCP